MKSLVVAVLIAASSATAACSTPREDFCDRLRESFHMTDLRNAIDEDDTAEISRQLQTWKELADDAPQDIAIDFRKVVDTVTSTVRSVTKVTSPGGESMPVDRTKLNEALGKIAPSAQAVASWADRKCNLSLTR